MWQHKNNNKNHWPFKRFVFMIWSRCHRAQFFFHLCDRRSFFFHCKFSNFPTDKNQNHSIRLPVGSTRAFNGDHIKVNCYDFNFFSVCFFFSLENFVTKVDLELCIYFSLCMYELFIFLLHFRFFQITKCWFIFIILKCIQINTCFMHTKFNSN